MFLIKVENLQAIEDVTLELPSTGIVQFSGGNSNGKSIIIKTITRILSKKIESQKKRMALIRDGKEFGTLSLGFKDKILTCNIHQERARTTMILYDINTKETITRSLRDGGFNELAEAFGFRTYGSGEVILQVQGTFEAVPFVTTSAALNFEMINSVVSDTVAERFLTSFEATYKAAKIEAARLANAIALADSNIKLVKTYDYSAYATMYNKLKKLYDVCRLLKPLELRKVEIPPKLIVIAKPPTLIKIPFYSGVPLSPSLESLSGNIKDMAIIRDGRCPTCNKLILEREDCIC